MAYEESKTTTRACSANHYQSAARVIHRGAGAPAKRRFHVVLKLHPGLDQGERANPDPPIRCVTKQKSYRTSISLPQAVYQAARQQMLHYDYLDFSAYLQALIRADAAFQPTQLHFGAMPEPLPGETSEQFLRRCRAVAEITGRKAAKKHPHGV